jgi:hypothetical protein
MDYPPAQHLRLCIAVGAPGIRIELPLARLMTAIPKSEQPAIAFPARLKRRPAHVDKKKRTKSPKKV